MIDWSAAFAGENGLFSAGARKPGGLALLLLVSLALFGCGGANTTPTAANTPLEYSDILARFQQIRTDYGTIDERLQSYQAIHRFAGRQARD